MNWPIALILEPVGVQLRQNLSFERHLFSKDFIAIIDGGLPWSWFLDGELSDFMVYANISCDLTISGFGTTDLPSDDYHC